MHAKSPFLRTLPLSTFYNAFLLAALGLAGCAISNNRNGFCGAPGQDCCQRLDGSQTCNNEPSVVCDLDTQKCLLPFGSACEQSSQCASGGCSDFQCCLPLGALTTVADRCCSGVLDNSDQQPRCGAGSGAGGSPNNPCGTAGKRCCRRDEASRQCGDTTSGDSFLSCIDGVCRPCGGLDEICCYQAETGQRDCQGDNDNVLRCFGATCRPPNDASVDLSILCDQEGERCCSPSTTINDATAVSQGVYAGYKCAKPLTCDASTGRCRGEPTTPDCSGQQQCGACVATLGCGFCRTRVNSVEGTCVAGDSVGASDNSCLGEGNAGRWITSAQWCDPCSRYFTCQACVANDACGLCNGRCVSGNANTGSTDGLCDKNSFIRSASQCGGSGTVPCAQRGSNCFECVGNTGGQSCAWTGSACVDASGLTNAGPTNVDQCADADDCRMNTTGNDCLNSYTCFFCESTTMSAPLRGKCLSRSEAAVGACGGTPRCTIQDGTVQGTKGEGSQCDGTDQR